MKNPKNMVLVNRVPISQPVSQPSPTYSIEGLTSIVERITSYNLNSVQRFASKLKSLGIYSKSDYYAKIKEFSAELPEYPMIQFNGFEWSMLTVAYNPYSYDECVLRIAELLKTHSTAVKSIGPKKDKLAYLYRLDDRIDLKYYDQLQADNTVGGYFKVRNRR
jgi:hypothetical protein